MQSNILATLLLIPALLSAPVHAEDTAEEKHVVVDVADAENAKEKTSAQFEFHLTTDDEEPGAGDKFALGILKTVAISLENLPDSISADMTEEDKQELERAIAEIESLSREKEQKIVTKADKDMERGVYIHSDWSDGIDVVGLVAVILLFGSPLLIVAIITYNRRRKREMVHATIDKMIEMGQDVPVEMLEALDKGDGAKPTMHKAVVNIAIGLAVGIALFSLAGADVATLALIPLFIGLAQLLVTRLDEKESK